MSSQRSTNVQTSDSNSADGPTGSPMDTQLLPDAWYMMKAVRSSLNSKFLSPRSARLAVASCAFSMSTRARSMSVSLGGRIAGLDGRSKRYSAKAAAVIAAMSKARKLRGAGDRKANSHHSSLL